MKLVLITDIDNQGDEDEDFYIYANSVDEAIETWKKYLKKTYPKIDFRTYKPLERIKDIVEFENDEEWDLYCKQFFVGGYRPDFVNEPEPATETGDTIK